MFYFFRFHEFEKRMPWFGSIIQDPKGAATFDDLLSTDLEEDDELEEMIRYSLNMKV